MATREEEIFAQVAMKNTRLTREQVDEAFRAQEELGEKGLSRHIKDILVDKGFLDKRVVPLITNAVAYAERREKDKKFGKRAIRKGHITEAQLTHALQVQATLFKTLQNVKALDDILIDDGLLSREQANSIWKEYNRYLLKQQTRDAALGVKRPSPLATAGGNADGDGHAAGEGEEEEEEEKAAAAEGAALPDASAVAHAASGVQAGVMALMGDSAPATPPVVEPAPPPTPAPNEPPPLPAQAPATPAEALAAAMGDDAIEEPPVESVSDELVAEPPPLPVADARVAEPPPTPLVEPPSPPAPVEEPPPAPEPPPSLVEEIVSADAHTPPEGVESVAAAVEGDAAVSADAHTPPEGVEAVTEAVASSAPAESSAAPTEQLPAGFAPATEEEVAAVRAEIEREEAEPGPAELRDLEGPADEPAPAPAADAAAHEAGAPAAEQPVTAGAPAEESAAEGGGVDLSEFKESDATPEGVAAAEEAPADVAAGAGAGAGAESAGRKKKHRAPRGGRRAAAAEAHARAFQPSNLWQFLAAAALIVGFLLPVVNVADVTGKTSHGVFAGQPLYSGLDVVKATFVDGQADFPTRDAAVNPHMLALGAAAGLLFLLRYWVFKAKKPSFVGVGGMALLGGAVAASFGDGLWKMIDHQIAVQPGMYALAGGGALLVLAALFGLGKRGLALSLLALVVAGGGVAAAKFLLDPATSPVTLVLMPGLR